MCVQYYFGFYLSAANWLDWMAKTDALYTRGQSCLYFIRSLASFNICRELLQIFYQTVIACALFFAVVCWGSSIKKRDATRLDKLTSVADGRTLSRFLSIMDSPLHPLNSAISRQSSSSRLLFLSCSKHRLRKSFLHHALRLFNSTRGGPRGMWM